MTSGGTLALGYPRGWVAAVSQDAHGSLTQVRYTTELRDGTRETAWYTRDGQHLGTTYRREEGVERYDRYGRKV
jgi:hypothetical protein